MASKKENYLVQIETSVVVSKTIKADSIEEALKKAQLIPEEVEVVRGARGFTIEWSNGSKVVGVIG